MKSDMLRRSFLKRLPRLRQQFFVPLAGVVALLAAGCASLPDVGPFVDASNQVRAAVATSGSVVESELRMLPDGESPAVQLRDAWQARNAAFDAVVDYSSSLQAIVLAGDQGAQSAARVADSVQSLADAVGVAFPGSPAAIQVGTDAFKFVSSQIARARAANSLAEAMSAAQPAVQRIAEAISLDFADLDAVFVAASTQVLNEHRQAFSDRLSYRNRILREMTGNDPTAAGALERHLQLGELLGATAEWHGEYLSGREVIEARLRAGRALIHAAAQIARDWAAAHGRLATAIQERRPVNTESLLLAAGEVRELVGKVREL